MERSHHVTVSEVKMGNPGVYFRVLPTADCPLPPMCRIGMDPQAQLPDTPPYLCSQFSQHAVWGRHRKQVWVQEGLEGKGSGAKLGSWPMSTPRGF